MASGDLNTLFTRNVPHILEKVFLNLDYESYKTCLEVNNEWKELLTSTSYQKTGRDVFHREILRDEMVLDYAIKKRNKEKIKIKYLDVGPQAQLPPPYAEDISALLTMVSS